jgi:hypothetical protein
MIITVKNRTKAADVDKKLLARKPTKVIVAKRHLGKVKWAEDALAYQKRKRNEWT